jgi:uncharacterized damage-inducible protein DinB
MDTLSQMQRMFRFDAWATGESLAALRASGDASPRARRLVAHVLAAQWVWLSRLGQGGASWIALWPDLTLDECETHRRDLAAAWTRYLGGLDAAVLESTVTYTNSAGQAHSSRVDDLITHVAMHGHYHRGQAAMELRAAGHTPAVTDYIHATRNGLLE